MEPTRRTVTAGDGTDLRLRAVAADGEARAGGKRPEEAVLFVHGATYPGRAAFAPAPAYSWLAATAAAGWDAFALDVWGYGERDPPEVASHTAFAPVFRLSEERVAEFDLGDLSRPARVVTQSEARERWESQFPDGTEPGEWRDGDAFRAFRAAVRGSNQGLAGTEDPAIRAPNGTLVGT